ncbi:[Fe-Fe] hydrogenase large subunit C-terminal domain-containing protein [Desulfococcaceae bacterium HSG8]|nr:[Fe-Fe] hydrogenase large subunit C-terminal domain-containing protein [Desulfococcaceae bacterium HSG8]
MENTFCYVHVDEELCVGCLHVIKSCPTKAIRMKESRPVIWKNLCIGCGECIRLCPTGAIKAATSEFEPIDKDQISVALVSPVLYSQFPEVMPENVLAGLRQMGFRHTVDMSYFLEMFQCAAEEFIVRNRKSREFPLPLISPVCPVVVRLIAFQFPSLLSHILPIMRPADLMVREVKHQIAREYKEKGKSVAMYYINPCPTKTDSEHLTFHHERPYTDRALGINDVYAELTRRLEKPGKPDHPDIFDYSPTENSLIWGISGGEILDMHIRRTLAVSGLKETIAYLEKIEMGLFRDVEYIEFRTCLEGCVGGTLTAVDKYLAKNVTRKVFRKGNMGRRVSRDNIHQLYENGRFSVKSGPAKLVATFGVRNAPLSIDDLMKIEELLEHIRGMDCAVCGAPDCRTFAEDVIRGNASLEDCLVLKAKSET